VRLAKVYGSPRLNNKDDPVDELFFILLSQMTTGPSYERVYDRLKAALPTWDLVLELPAAQLSSLIADAGLSNQKTLYIRSIAARLKADFGGVNLDALAALEDDAALRYLTSLPGVGTKTAKCVLMYSLGRQLLPVDTHTARLAFRLGLVSRSRPGTILDRELDDAIAPPLRYDFHVNAVAHGRACCRAIRPACGDCPIQRLCPQGREARRGAKALPVTVRRGAPQQHGRRQGSSPA
jgi:endonuclease III